MCNRRNETLRTKKLLLSSFDDNLTMTRRLATALTLLLVACSGDIARWTGRSEGTISFDPGMTRQEAQHRSTIKINQYGDQGRFFDVVLATERIRFKGCVEYATSTKDDRITMLDFDSEHESWPDLLHSVRHTDALLRARGWRRDPRTRNIGSLPANPRQAQVRGYRGGIDAFDYIKGGIGLTLTPSMEGDLPWYRPAKRSKIFWRRTSVYLMEEWGYTNALGRVSAPQAEGVK